MFFQLVDHPAPVARTSLGVVANTRPDEGTNWPANRPGGLKWAETQSTRNFRFVPGQEARREGRLEASIPACPGSGRWEAWEAHWGRRGPCQGLRVGAAARWGPSSRCLLTGGARPQDAIFDLSLNVSVFFSSFIMIPTWR